MFCTFKYKTEYKEIYVCNKLAEQMPDNSFKCLKHSKKYFNLLETVKKGDRVHYINEKGNLQLNYLVCEINNFDIKIKKIIDKNKLDKEFWTSLSLLRKTNNKHV